MSKGSAPRPYSVSQKQFDDNWDRIFGKNKQAENCGRCYNCLKGKVGPSGLPVVLTMMIVCEHCGNKRCPHATDHNLACTKSNKVGQPGSRY